MSDAYDRNDSTGTFVMGLLAGAVIGAGIGMLFTTKAGADLRNQLAEQAAGLADQASKSVKKVTDTAGEWAERGRDAYGKAKDAASKGADEAQAYVRDVSNSAAKTVETASRRS